jgi:hypothetical protein
MSISSTLFALVVAVRVHQQHPLVAVEAVATYVGETIFL